MQTATSRAFAQGVPQLEALLARTSLARQEAQARVKVTAPRYQAMSRGEIWEVVDLGTGAVMGMAYRYNTALVFVDAMEAAARCNLVGRQ
jgi:bisphosphoglycerate-independent phosphoglycerate mutase (AlkP superfamily)